MWGRVKKIVLSLPFMIVAGLFGLYLVFGFFLVNPLTQKLLPWVGKAKLASQLSVQQVKFNPLTLEVTVNGLKLAGLNGQPLAGFERLYLNFDVTGLFRWIWRFEDIQIDRPRVTFLVDSSGRFNWAALITKLDEDKKPPSDTMTTMTRVRIDHIRVGDGLIEYTDANRADRPFKSVLLPLGIELDGLSTLPEERGNYMIMAKLPEQGGTLRWKGDIGLNPLASKGELGLDGLQLNNLLRVIKTPRNFELPSGELAVGLRYHFAMLRDRTGEDVPQLQVNGANLIVRHFTLAPRGGGPPVLELAEARISDANLDLAQRRVDVAGVSLTGAKLAATRDVRGTLNWQTLFAPGEGAKAPGPTVVQTAPEASAPAQSPVPWKVGIREIKLADWAAHFTDLGFARPLVVNAQGFALTAAASGEWGAKPAIDVGPVNAALGPIQVLSGKQEVASLNRATLVNAGLKLAESRIVIDAVELNGIRTSVVSDKNKNLNWTDILKAVPGEPAPAPARNAASAAGDKTAMDVRLARLSLEGIEAAIVDASPNAPVKLDVAQGFVKLKNLSLDMDKAVPAEIGFTLKQGGRFSVGGSVTPGKRSGKLNLKLTELSLKPFAPYVNRFAKLHLRSGSVSTQGKLLFSQAKAGLMLDFNGGFAVNRLALNEEETSEPFLGWDKLTSDHLKLKLGPNRLHINELLAIHPFGKVIIFQDKSMNLKRILRDFESEGAAKPEPELPAKAKSKDQAVPFPLAIERLQIAGANFEFADFSLTPQFGTRMHDLTGVVTGLSNDPATTALVELDGKVDEFGSARVRGSIQPFRATDFTDLKLTFRNLEMTNLTPYSGKFAGRKIDSGKLSVDLEYKVKQRQMTGENKFVINKIKLGERVDSPEAVNLPLDLAIAILEDSDGVIDLDLPVSGSLDDPQFSYGRIIWKAVVNVLTKIVTAPFRALGHLLGISSDKIEAAEFDFGAATLLPPELEKLKEIGQILAKRPGLSLSIAPAYDLSGDTRALQEMQIRRDVSRRMGLKVNPDQDPGPIDTTNPRAQQALEALYGDRFDKQGGLTAIKAEYKKPKEGVKPFHAEMLERLTLQIPVTDVELQRLAQARGEAMKQTLIAQSQMDGARISVDESVKKDDHGKVAVCKMSLGVNKKAAVRPAPAPAPASP